MKIVIKLGAALLLAASVPALAGTLDTGVATPGNTTATVAADSTPVAFSVFLPLRNTTALKALVAAQSTPGSASYQKWLTSAQFAASYGPTPAALQAAAAEMTRLGFTVDSVGSRTVHVTGTAATVAAAFGSRLNAVQGTSGPAWLVAGKPLALTPALTAVGAIVPGFANVAPKISHAVPAAVDTSTDGRNGPAGSYRFTELKQIYDYPAYNATGANGSQLDGTGARVAIVMSGDVLDSDISLQLQHENFTAVTGKPTPALLRLPIDGGAPFDANSGGTFEASLDTQAVIQGAPGAVTTLVTIPDLADTHIMDAYQAIVDSNQYDIVSSSFGGAESFNLPSVGGGNTLQLYSEIFLAGNAKGITWIASSGDSGGLGCPSVSYFNAPNSHALFVPCIETPAADPNVTAVGGGNVISTVPAPGTFSTTYVAENGLGDPEVPYDPYGLGENVSGGYWGATGGQSLFFPRPAYQGLVYTGSSTARTVPDVGMLVGGCPGGLSVTPCGQNHDRSAVLIYVGGAQGGVIGTSVSAPEFASAVAVAVGQQGRQGNLNFRLYQTAKAQNNGGVAAYHRDQPSNDGYWTNAFPAKGYNYIFGNGSPDVRVLFGLTAYPAAGAAKSITNP